MSDLNEFKEKVAIITGASAGIGRITAYKLAELGTRVVLASRREDQSRLVAETITSQGGEAFFVQTDVSKADDVHRLTEATLKKYGRLDFAFNNAGIEGSHYVSAADYEEEVWDKVIDINLKGVWLCMKYQIPAMLETGQGSIVNMASVAGLIGGSIGIAYYGSKHGVIGLTRAAAMEYAKKRIRVNAVCPAVIKTDMADRLFVEDIGISRAITERHPIGRIGTPEEVADGVIFLLSEKASFITGHPLVIDGGLVSH